MAVRRNGFEPLEIVGSDDVSADIDLRTAL